MKSRNFILHTCFAIIITGLFFLGAGNNNAKAYDNGLQPSTRYFKMSPKVTEDDYMAKTIIFKVKQDYVPYCTLDQVSISSLQEQLNEVGSTGIKKKFPFAKRPEKKKNKYGMDYANLTLIYEFKYTADLGVEQVINKLYALGIFEYVEPHYIYQLTYTPNDPQVGSQYHIGQVKAYQAWDITKGDTNVVIGIVDTGADTDHPDLMTQYKHNAGDPIDGSDNDGDGYIDNNLGWDFEDDDNDPQVVGSDHGVHVSGCAAAATDNGTGVAGPGFNCKILPIRAGDANLTYGYDGIAYAADHGADIINCSWGGQGGGQLGQDVIDYATINKDALVVAAAGNDGSEDIFYPASYNHVLNVAWTGSSDNIDPSSNFGYNIDVCAPGGFVYATVNGGNYGYNSGTSMASPVAAGCAALIRSELSFLDAIQVGEQLKVTCDDIYSVNNVDYQDKLGAGRVNAFAAVSGVTKPSVIMTERNVTDGNDEAFVIGDTLVIDGIYTNFLFPTGSITATLTASSANVNIIDGNTSLGTLGAFGGTADNISDPYLVKILPGASFNEKVTFELALTDGTYNTSIFFQIIINVDYINIAINDVATSITSKSLTGFNDFSIQQEGLGFIYPYNLQGTGDNILFDCGLMIGISSNVSDNVRTTGGGTDQDFVSVNNVQRLPVPVFSEFDCEGDFNDASNSSPLGIDVGHKAFAWSETGHRKYVIVEYNIKNNSGGTLSDVYAGLFADWDINDYAQNKGGTVQGSRLGYIYDTQTSGVWAGMQVVSTSGGFIHNAMFNNATDDPGGGGVYPNTTYGTPEKYTSLSTIDLTSGGSGVGKDVCNVVSTGPFTLSAGDSVIVAFAIMAGDDLADITETADSAYIKYNGVPLPTGINQNKAPLVTKVYPNPNSGIVTLVFGDKIESNSFELSLRNLLGQEVINEERSFNGQKKFQLNLENLNQGVYFLNVKGDHSDQSFKIHVQ